MNEKNEKIIFFTTFGCHLCEEVEKMLSFILYKMGNNVPYQLEIFDIIDDENIMQKYRATIPVLKNENTQHELMWPFSFEQLCQWLKVEVFIE
ncbi:MAG: glutaredoxin family protein [Kangiellaceae bacterium]|nr:glutaredoxin family protein [Kangiellaceae bacterium]